MNHNRKILVVEDDASLNKNLSGLLQEAGYETQEVFDGEQALLYIAKHCYDLILLDVMLPKKDGLSVLSIIRKNHQIPVIIVSAKGAEQERVQGFICGVDDYLSKPFNSQELLLRIDALLRRFYPQKQKAPKTDIDIDDLYVNNKTKQVQVNTLNVDLTPIEFKLLWLLISNKNQLISKAYAYQVVLNKSLGAYDRSIDMHVCRIRKKLLAASWDGNRINTVHGKGYCFQ